MKVLHENKFGHIARCQCCQELQIKLGNVVLSFSDDQYSQFDNFFNEIREDIFTEKLCFKKNRRYVVVTNYKGVVLSLTHTELLDTIELLNFSTMMISVNEIMDLSENF